MTRAVCAKSALAQLANKPRVFYRTTQQREWAVTKPLARHVTDVVF